MTVAIPVGKADEGIGYRWSLVPGFLLFLVSSFGWDEETEEVDDD